MYIHHGGQFGSFDDAVFYVGGHLVLKLELDVDRFGYLNMEEEIEKLGYVSWKSISHTNLKLQLIT